MTSSNASEPQTYSQAPGPKGQTELGYITIISRHAIKRCMYRCNISCHEAIKTILRVAKTGTQWQTPKGPALRTGAEVIGVAPDKAHKAPLSGTAFLVVTTYYKLDKDGSLRAFADTLKAQNRHMRPQTRKPGRHMAWSRLRRQGKHCRRPPRPSEPPA